MHYAVKKTPVECSCKLIQAGYLKVAGHSAMQSTRKRAEKKTDKGEEMQ